MATHARSTPLPLPLLMRVMVVATILGISEGGTLRDAAMGNATGNAMGTAPS